MYQVPHYKIQLVRDGSQPSTWRKFSNSLEVFNMLQEPFALLDREELVVIMLDSKNQMIGINVVSVGCLSQSIVHPREVFKPLVLASAAAFVVAHNHTSGDPAPSREDRDCSRRLLKAGKVMGIKMLDHVVIGGESYFSFADSGVLAELEAATNEPYK